LSRADATFSKASAPFSATFTGSGGSSGDRSFGTRAAPAKVDSHASDINTLGASF
jgi:hypothetical protein